MVSLAVSRNQAGEFSEKKDQKKEQKDTRNLYLAREGSEFNIAYLYYQLLSVYRSTISVHLIYMFFVLCFGYMVLLSHFLTNRS